MTCHNLSYTHFPSTHHHRCNHTSTFRDHLCATVVNTHVLDDPWSLLSLRGDDPLTTPQQQVLCICFSTAACLLKCKLYMKQHEATFKKQHARRYNGPAMVFVHCGGPAVKKTSSQPWWLQKLRCMTPQQCLQQSWSMTPHTIRTHSSRSASLSYWAGCVPPVVATEIAVHDATYHSNPFVM